MKSWIKVMLIGDHHHAGQYGSIETDEFGRIPRRPGNVVKVEMALRLEECFATTDQVAPVLHTPGVVWEYVDV